MTLQDVQRAMTTRLFTRGHVASAISSITGRPVDALVLCRAGRLVHDARQAQKIRPFRQGSDWYEFTAGGPQG